MFLRESIKRMKKIIIALTILTLTTGAYAQDAYTDYACGFAEKKYDIQVGKEGTLYIDIMSLDGSVSKAGLMLSRKREEDFSACLDTAFKKYTAWKDIAIKNNVKELVKDIPCTCRVEGFFKYGDWQFDYYVSPTFEFTVMESRGKTWHLMIMRTGKMTSSSNQFMECDGAAIVFSTPEEFKDFMTKIKPANVDAFIANKPKTEELFK